MRLSLFARRSERSDGLAHMRNAGPGWYFDPDDVAIYRYWDGQDWTDERTDVLPPASRSF